MALACLLFTLVVSRVMYLGKAVTNTTVAGHGIWSNSGYTLDADETSSEMMTYACVGMIVLWPSAILGIIQIIIGFIGMFQVNQRYLIIYRNIEFIFSLVAAISLFTGYFSFFFSIISSICRCFLVTFLLKELKIMHYNSYVH